MKHCLHVTIIVMAGVLMAAAAFADDTLLDTTDYSKQYILQLSGTVMNETFSGVQALLTLMPPAPYSTHPYQIIIQGFPKKNSRNSFFWNGDNAEMTAIANEITCTIHETYIKPVPMFFIFMSPELLKHTGALELQGNEGKKFAEKNALPTLINARAGSLKLNIYSNFISGTIWMKGYDPVEHAFVQYSANLYGRRSYNLHPKQELKK